MNYIIYKLEFTTGVHFGKYNLSDGESTFAADTLFSALCQECLKEGDDTLNQFYDKVKQGRILISDAFPYLGEEYYIPKPMLITDYTANTVGDSIMKKAYKKLTYIPSSKIELYRNGRLNALEEEQRLKCLGNYYLKNAVAVRGLEEPSPYHIGVYQFLQGNGLYVIIGYAGNAELRQVEELLLSLSYAGIGGKRSAGYGKFILRKKNIPRHLEERLGREENELMLMSMALPRDDEMEDSLRGARYTLIKRSGFVNSKEYAIQQMRKRDLYVFKAGSCFFNAFQGAIYDVSDGGRHPVYRYAKPMFLEVT